MPTRWLLLWATALSFTAGRCPVRAASPEMRSRVETEFGHYWTAGPPSTLSYPQLLEYVKDKQFKKIHTSKVQKNDLTHGEYNAAFLYARKSGENGWELTADPKAQNEQFFADVERAHGHLTAAQLYLVNDYWHLHVDLTTDRFWALAHDPKAALGANLQHDAPSLTVDQLAAFLQHQDEQSARPRKAAARLQRLQALNKASDAIRRLAFFMLHAEERFEDLDTDGDGYLDLWEFTQAYNYVKKESVAASDAPGDFVALAGPDLHLTESEFVVAADPDNSTAANLQLAVQLESEALDEWGQIAGQNAAEASAARVQRAMKASEAAERVALRQVSGPGFVPGTGYVLIGNRVQEADKTISVDSGRPALIARLVKEFDNAGDKADAAAVSYKSQIDKTGKSTSLSLDGTLRLDYRIPDSAIHPAIGFQIDRGYSKVVPSDPTMKRSDTPTDTRKYFALADLLLHSKRGLFVSNEFLIGPVVESDKINRIRKLTGLIQWEPRFRTPGFSPGDAIRLAGSHRTYPNLYLIPRLALEPGQILDHPKGQPKPNASFFRVGADLGLAIAKELTLTYKVKQRYSVSGPSHQYYIQDLTLQWNLVPDERISIQADYSRGRDSPDFDKVEEATVGLGLKF